MSDKIYFSLLMFVFFVLFYCWKKKGKLDLVKLEIGVCLLVYFYNLEISEGRVK